MRKSPCRQPFHYGWVIVFTGILTLFACLGLARFAFGMLLPAMGAGLKLGYDQMGYISTGNFAGYLLSVALAPLLIRLLRPRLLIVCGLLLIALCMLAISRGQDFFTVAALYFFVGMGSGFANIPVMVLVSHWFRRERRGRAAGLMVMGSALGIVFSGFLIPRLNLALGPEGWRTGWLVLGLIALGVSLIAAILVRNDPTELGLEPVGRKTELPPQALVPKNPPGAGRILLELGLLYLLFGATFMIYGTFIVTSLVVEHGIAEARAGLFWSWVGGFGLLSGVLFGTLSDRIGRKGGLMLVFAVQTAAYLLAGANLGTPALMLSVVLYGLVAFAIPTIMAAAVGDYLGLSRAAAAFSTITVFFAVGQTLGPGAAGMLAETMGTFRVSYLIAAVLTGAGVLLAARLPKPHDSRD
ncbi:MFS transporter [Geoalkalibacter sp.]|uniref:MFS transporter n=1 Tax=Geoalkalibacter sp. TaxID=3041440 RepID=UPI00272E565A|nr:MFS transporter [Geoalkalibacter sp.]